MNRNEVKNLLPILKAYANGECVQFLSKLSGRWEDIPQSGSSFGLPAFNYRIKPKEVKVERFGIINLSAEAGGDPWVTSLASKEQAEAYIRQFAHGRRMVTFSLTGSYER